MKTKLLTICLLLFTSQVFAECEYTWNDRCLSEDRYYDYVRDHCAYMSRKANSDFSAKKIYETCLNKWQVPDTSFFDILK